MSHRIIAGALLVLSILGIGLGWALLYHPDLLLLCKKGSECLNEFLVMGVGHPLFWHTRWLPVLFAVLLFVPRKIFFSWLKFVWWFAIIPLAVIIFTPTSSHGWLPGLERTDVTEPMVNLVVIASIIFVSWKILQNKKA